MTRADSQHGQEEALDPGDAIFAFEAIDEQLLLVPLAARRVLDAMGQKLALAGWLSLPPSDRWALVRAGLAARVSAGDPAFAAILSRAVPLATAVAPLPDPDSAVVPAALLEAFGADRPRLASQWGMLRPLDRYVLAKYAHRPDKLRLAYDEIRARAGGVPLAHLSPEGHAHMVDVGAKSPTSRRAVATARVRTTAAVVHAIAAGGLPKGDVFAVARVAGLMASKRTPELIPLCHPVQTTRAAVDFEADAAQGAVLVRATVEALDRTGVEMEAMVAASVAALTVYDMIKSADRWAAIDRVRLEEKSGGKSGPVVRPPEAP